MKRLQRLTMSVHEAAQLAGVSVDCFRDGIRRGEIPSVRIRSRVLVPIYPFFRWLGVDTNSAIDLENLDVPDKGKG